MVWTISAGSTGRGQAAEQKQGGDGQRFSPGRYQTDLCLYSAEPDRRAGGLVGFGRDSRRGSTGPGLSNLDGEFDLFEHGNGSRCGGRLVRGRYFYPAENPGAGRSDASGGRGRPACTDRNGV